MSPNKKIYTILKEIKHESSINPDPEWVEFKLNANFIAPGVMMSGEEGRIIIKLEKEGAIELHLPNGKDDEQDAMLSGYTPIEFMWEHNLIWIKLLPKFQWIYFKYRTKSFGVNFWYLSNPFWLLWKFLRFLFFPINFIWRRHKIIASIVTILGGLLVYDWTQAWDTIQWIIDKLK